MHGLPRRALPFAPMFVALSAARGAVAGSNPAGLFSRLAPQALLTVAALVGAYLLGPLLGMALPVTALAILGVGAVAVEALPAQAMPIAAATGLALVFRLNPVYAGYHAAMVVALYSQRRRPWAFALVAVTLAMVIPKTLFRHFYHQPGFYNWFNESAMALVIFVSATWWRELREGRLPAGAESAPLGAWATLYLFPTHAANPMVFGPGELWRRRSVETPAVLASLGLVALKATAHAGLRAAFPGNSYVDLGPFEMAALTRAELRGVVLLNYIDLALVLSGTADLAVLFARLYGWPLASPFRWALLAWNPVELWRRWGIYNRRFLLKNVYFPLGGSRRRPYLNVMLTFVASALVLHSGWFGSRYWIVGVGGWRDQTLYFLLQGAAVCGCLVFFRLRGKDVKDDTQLSWRWSRIPATAATQALSALVHVVVLAQAVPLTERWKLIGRCLGW